MKINIATLRNKITSGTCLSDIRCWIIFFFVIRLIGITNPPLETGHNWRQSLTAMIARNFLETDNNIFYPRIDMAGNESGIIGSEFPLFNYLIYVVSFLLGYEHWYGRLINLLVSSFGALAFYRLIEKISDKKLAFNSTLIFMASIWFAFSRKIMPDTFSVSLVLIGLNYGYDYLLNARIQKLYLFFLFTCLGMLCKIPALSLFSLVALVLLHKEIIPEKRNNMLVLSLIGLAIVAAWYFHWVPYLVNTYHYQLYFPKSISEGLLEIIPLSRLFFQKFYFDSLSSYSSLPFVLIGIFYLFKESSLQIKLGIGIISITFLLFTFKTGAVFPLHNYYIIPFTPVMAFMAAYGLKILPKNYSKIVLLVIVCEGILNQQHDFFVKESEKYKLQLETLCENRVPKNDLILINGGNSPQSLYFCNRKGWTIENDKINPVALNEFKLKGAKVLIIDKNHFNSPNPSLPLLFEDNNFSFFQIK